MITQEVFDLAFELCKQYIDEEIAALRARIVELEIQAAADFQREAAQATRERMGSERECSGPH